MSALVMIVEDERAVRELLEEALQDSGYETVSAKDGLDALGKLDSLSERRPSLVLLDLMMPRLDGHGFLRELQERGMRSDLSVLILSAADFTASCPNRVPADAYLAKPVDLDTLFYTIDQLAI